MNKSKTEKAIENLRNRSGDYAAKAFNASSRNELDKAGDYRTKSMTLSKKADLLQAKLNSQ